MRNEILKIEKLAEKYNENRIPLYVSYPTTSWWKDNVGESAYINLFKNKKNGLMYFHFPYCEKSCYYCCCYKEVLKNEEDNDVYLSYMEKEISLKAELIGNSLFKEVKKMHWGGGTPTLMTCRQIERIYEIISKNINLTDGKNSSMSIEAYPDKKHLTKNKFRLLKQLGFNRISIGIQDFDERIQKTINRDCNVSDVQELIWIAKDMGLKVHIDLCFGLPFQGINELSRTVNIIADMEPDRVAVFPYAHFPMIFPMQKLIPGASIANSFMMTMMMIEAENIFARKGYLKVGYDHFVREKDALYIESQKSNVIRDFMGYSISDRDCFMGFGCSAISDSEDQLYHNAKTIAKYYDFLDKEQIPLEYNMGHSMTKDDLLRSKIILKSILTEFVIDKTRINNEYRIVFDEYFKDELEILQKYEKDGLVEGVKSEKLNLTSNGRKFARHIAYVFDSYYMRKK